MADIVLNRATHIEFPNNPEVAVGKLQIESGSLLLEEILCEKDIVFGETNATRFEATVYNLQDVSGLKIKVYQTDIDGNNRRNLFEGYVDSCKQDKDGYYRKLVAYDAIYSIGNANVAGWWYQFWSTRETATIRELRYGLCDWVGIRHNLTVNLYNDDLVCKKPANLSSVSFNTILFWICEIQCTIPHIDRDGVLQFISPTNTYVRDITNDYDRNTSEFEGYVTANIDAVELYGYDGNLVASTNTTGAVTSRNTYTIKDNTLLFGIVNDENSSYAANFVNSYLAQISGITYTPVNLNMIVSDLDLNVGNHIQVGNVSSIVLQNTLSGNLLVEQEIRSSGNEYLQDSHKTQSAEYLSIEARTQQLRNDIITDDLLNYMYMNNTAYEIEDTVTPLIELLISMPTTSNLVFLATINLETYSTETREVQETVKLGDDEYTMTRTEKVPVVVETYFEWNGAEILTNKPTETYSEDGKHLLNLMFFTIGGRQVGGDVSFRVFLKAEHGRVYIGQNQVNATIISKGSSAGSLPWDGTISVDDTLNPDTVATFSARLGGLREIVDDTEQIPASSGDTETAGTITPEFGTISINDIDDTVEHSIT